MLALFALALFTSAGLLFCVEPMIARMILPLLGGSPAVWNTCMVFFQAALLAGYAYAHAVSSRLGLKAQACVQLVLLAGGLAVLPIGISTRWGGSVPLSGNPAPWLLALLVVTVGLPFFVVSTTAPLLQYWFAQTGHASARDPYFLYGASNLGSMLALLGYPLALEPSLGLAQQSRAWAGGYLVLAILVLACAVVAVRLRAAAGTSVVVTASAADESHVSLGARLRWVGLAFVPSSLMLGVTTYLATDIASVPLLWVVPLAIYLATFILVFARRPPIRPSLLARVQPMMIVALALVLFLGTVRPITIPLHLLTFFVVAMVCHGELAARRPTARHLTAFYLAMSLGGVLGGVFNALVAPLVFTRVVEYPLALVLACLVRPGGAASGVARGGQNARRECVLDIALPALLGLAVACIGAQLGSGNTAIKVLMGTSALACYAFKDRPIRFALGLAAVLAARGLAEDQFGRVLYQERDFFGVMRVTDERKGKFHALIHGSTIHGRQSQALETRGEPLTYYTRTGPAGDVFATCRQRVGWTGRAVAVVGLGIGSLAAYAETGQRYMFYEIDPAVERVARDEKYFTFLSTSPAKSIDVLIGDARLRLREAQGGTYSLIVLDAFSSDAIPVHLLTREAIALFREKLTRDGLLAFHISNRYFELEPVLAALARDAGLVCILRRDQQVPQEEVDAGKLGSVWAVMAAHEADLGALATDPRWQRVEAKAHERVWTDDYSNIIAHFRLRLN